MSSSRSESLGTARCPQKGWMTARSPGGTLCSDTPSWRFLLAFGELGSGPHQDAWLLQLSCRLHLRHKAPPPKRQVTACLPPCV